MNVLRFQISVSNLYDRKLMTIMFIFFQLRVIYNCYLYTLSYMYIPLLTCVFSGVGLRPGSILMSSMLMVPLRGT